MDEQDFLVTSPERLAISRACFSVLLHKPELARSVQSASAIMENHLLAWILAAQAQGRLVPADAGVAAQLLTAMMEGAINHPALFLGVPDAGNLAAIRAEMVATFLARYGSPSAE